MDSYLIFDPQNNLIFAKMNEKFYHHIIEFADQNNSICEKHDFVDEVFINEPTMNLLSLLLTPYIVSQRFNEVNTNIKFDCIQNTEAVYVMVFYYKLLFTNKLFSKLFLIHIPLIIVCCCFCNQKHGFIFLYIYGDYKEKQIFMQRKVQLFASIMLMVFGDGLQTLKTNSSLTQLASNILKSWESLSNDMTFLLEVIINLL